MNLLSSRTRTVGLVAAASVAMLTLAGCSSSASSDASGSTAAPSTAAPSLPEGLGGGGASGEIAAISGSTLQVQSTDSQTAVTFTDTTTITQSVAAALSDVANGVCITAITGGFGGGAPGSAGSSDSSSSSSTDAASTAATTVVITDAVDGSCDTAGFGGGMGGELPEGFTPPTDGAAPDGVMPSGAPDGAMPTGAPDGAAGGFGGFTSGLVTAVSGSTITVQTSDPSGTTASSDVVVDSATTYTKTVSGDSSALAVGLCVTAMGEADDSGTVAATSLALSEAGDSGCSTGFGPGAGGPGGQRPDGAAGASTSGDSSTSGS